MAASKWVTEDNKIESRKTYEKTNTKKECGLLVCKYIGSNSGLSPPRGNSTL